MLITDLRLTTRFIPFRTTYGISSATYTGETFLLLKLIGADGTVGLADSVTAVPFGYEDVGTLRYMIETYLRPAIVGYESLDVEAANQRLEKATPGHPMAKAVLDIALHDLNARQLGVPLYTLLGGAVRRSVPLIGAVGLSDTDRMVREAVDLAAQGYLTIKLKFGRDPRSDDDNIRAVLNAIGPDVKLRIDANQACNLVDYLPLFRKLDGLGLEFIEQPLPSWDLAGYRRLCAALDTPILIDEGVYTPHDLMGLIQLQAVDAVNIKILKTGLTGGKRIAAIAEAAGLPCLVGSMFETGVGTAASLHFAAATPAITRASECAFPLLLSEDVLDGAPYSTHPAEPEWPIPGGPGLGVALRPEVDALL